jgi:hypothetical protein
MPFGVTLCGAIGFFILLTLSATKAGPPFSGTIFIDPDIITGEDPSAFENLEDAGRGRRQMYDRRPADWVNLNAYLFTGSYDDGLEIEFQVNPEFGTQDNAREQALKYAGVIGRLPTSLRRDVETSWIHKGVNPFGGGNRNLLIHTGQGENYIASGILEETFVHEAAHTSLDARHANSSGWRAAQSADPEFISTYARDNQNREDIAESFLVFLAVRYREERISNSLQKKITDAIPNRIAYFDELSLDWYPVVMPEQPPFVVTTTTIDSESGDVHLECTSQPEEHFVIELSNNLIDWQETAQVNASEGTTTRSSATVPEESPREVYLRVRKFE